MEASKIQISARTAGFYEQPMTMARRAELKREAIMELIKKKPAGTPIRLREFGAVIGIFGKNKENNIQGVVKTMLKKNMIGRVPIEGSRSYSYYVNDARTTSKHAGAIVPPNIPPIATPPPRYNYHFSQRLRVGNRERQLKRIHKMVRG